MTYGNARAAHNLRTRIVAFALLLALVSSSLTAVAAPVYRKVDSAAECAEYIFQNMKGGSTSVHIETPRNVGSPYFQEVYAILQMLYSDYCALEYGWIGDSRHWVVNANMGGMESERKIAESRAKQIISEIITPDMSMTERLAVIHDYVIDNMEYDLSVVDDRDNAPRYNFSAYGMLVKGSGVCDAYSAAFTLLCRTAGLSVMKFVSGPMDHSWNVVLLGNSIFFVDCTFNDTGDVSDTREYFLLTPEQLFQKGHRWSEGTFSLVRDVIWDYEYRAAGRLNALGLFMGTDLGFELSRVPNRVEGSIMLLRLMGLEDEAVAYTGASSFIDLYGYYIPYIAYMESLGLADGIGDRMFNPGGSIDLRQYMTFVLRALGYDDSAGDFEWTDSLNAAVRFGVLDKGDAAVVSSSVFDRGTMAYISYKALFAPTKEGVRVADWLMEKGVFHQAVFEEILKYS